MTRNYRSGSAAAVMLVLAGLGSFGARADPAQPGDPSDPAVEQVKRTRATAIKQVLTSFFPDSDRIAYFQLTPGPAQRDRIQAILGQDLLPARWTFFRATTGDRLDGYAWTGTAWGRGHEFSIALSLSVSGVVVQLEVFDYHSSRGKAVLRDEFRQRFVGRSAADGLRPDLGIDAVTGATISSNAIIERVRAALLVLDQYIGAHAPGGEQ